MEVSLQRELRRLRDNAGSKRVRLLATAYRQTQRRKRLNIAAGVLALLSAATVTSVLADFTPAPAMKVLAALLSTVSGLISLLGNTSFKDSEVLELYKGAARYLTLRERAHLVSFNPDIDVHERYKALEELEVLYSDLDLQFQRYIAIEAQSSISPPNVPFTTGPDYDDYPPTEPAIANKDTDDYIPSIVAGESNTQDPPIGG